MSRVVCYIQRAQSGTALVAVRLCAPGFDRQWNAPLDGAPAGPGPDAPMPSAPGLPTSAVAHVRAAAAWIAENLAALGTRFIDAIVVDPDGAVCTWLSAPSPDPKVISATLSQAGLAGADSTSGAAGRLALLSSPDFASASAESSIQALAVADESDAPPPRRRAARSAPRAAEGHPARRFALLSIPDTPVRVLIDALDDRSIEVGSVVSLWHALAAQFDPSARAMPGADDFSRVVAGSEVASAVLMVDPLGRLNWAWSLAGRLVAGGSMRLKRVALRRSAPANASSFEPASDPDAARRLQGAQPEPPEYDERLECSTPEVGRLVLDWLSWSAQLGQTPQRVLCFGPLTVASGPGGSGGGAAGAGAADSPAGPGFAEALAAAWPGATVDMIEQDDPIGLVLARLIGVDQSPASLDDPQRGVKTDALSSGGRSGASSHDPRLAIATLSARPGRATRSLYRWGAVAILAASVVLIAAGIQLHRSADRARESIAQVKQQQKDALQSINDIVPNIALSSKPEADLRSRLDEMMRQSRSVRQLPPILPEVVRLLTAFDTVRSKLDADKRDGLKIREISMSPISATCKLEVPDSVAGPDVEVALQATQGLYRWRGNTGVSTTGAARLYVLTATAAAEAPTPTAAPGAGGARR